MRKVVGELLERCEAMEGMVIREDGVRITSANYLELGYADPEHPAEDQLKRLDGPQGLGPLGCAPLSLPERL